MKILLYIYAICICCVANAQNNYYSGKTEIIGDNVVFDCEEKFKGRVLILSNQNNTNQSFQLTYSDGTPATLNPSEYSRPQNIDAIKGIIASAFSHDELTLLKSKERASIMIHCIINSQGVISEIRFMIVDCFNYISFSPDRLAALEQQIKQNIIFSVDPKMFRGNFSVVSTSVWIKLKDV